MIQNLPTGIYNVSLTATSYTNQNINNVSVTAPTQTSGINFTLIPGFVSIRGRVIRPDGTPRGGACVQVASYNLPFDQSNWGDCSISDSNGEYTFLNLAPGTYRLREDADTWASEFYSRSDTLASNNPAYLFDNASPIDVKDQATTVGINFYLHPSGSISGKVLDSQGNPISGISFSITGTSDYFNFWTYPDGSYALDRLPTGDYYLWLIVPGFDPQYYGNFNSGTNPIHVQAPYDTPNINFVLTPAGSISGTITDLVTGKPLANVSVVARDSPSSYIQGVYTDSNRDYTIAGPSPGDYYLRRGRIVRRYL